MQGTNSVPPRKECTKSRFSIRESRQSRLSVADNAIMTDNITDKAVGAQTGSQIGDTEFSLLSAPIITECTIDEAKQSEFIARITDPIGTN